MAPELLSCRNTMKPERVAQILMPIYILLFIVLGGPFNAQDSVFTAHLKGFVIGGMLTTVTIVGTGLKTR